MKTWVTADLHLGHANLISGTSKWEDKSKCRPYTSTDEHDEYILTQINKYIQPNDRLIIIGDVIFGNKNKLLPFLDNLSTYHVDLVYGNHDEFIKENRTLEWGGVYSLAKDLFGNIYDKHRFYHNGKLIVLDHYPIVENCWEDASKGSVLLHGHVHGALHDKRVNRRIDVGWDSSYLYFNEYRPFELDEAIELSIITSTKENRNETGRITNFV